jgi:hypothetical protein
VTVLAHGVGQSTDLPLPLDLVLQAGAATVVISFLGSALFWRRPRLQSPTYRGSRASRWRTPLRAVVLLVAAVITASALFGPREPNPAAHALFVWLWVGLVPVSVVLGPVWRAVNPLRTLYALLPRRPARRPLPGEWPAAVALLAFAWFELVAPGRTDPLVIGVCLTGYAVLQLALAARYGEQWFARGDAFELYSDLAGRLSPLRWRPPLSGLAADHPAGIGRAAFLAVWWGSTIFDSASGSPAWAALVQSVGYPILLGTAGLVAVCAVVLFGVRRLSGRVDVTNSLIPVAVGYTLAHYLTLLLVEAPRGVLLAVQQWGLAPGARWDVIPDPRVVSVLQVALILTGHALGVLVAHDQALAAPTRPLTRPASAAPPPPETAAPQPAGSPPGTSAPATAERAGRGPATSEPATSEPATSEPATSEPARSEPARSEPDSPRLLLATLADELPVVLFMIACTWAGLFLLFVR